MFDGYHFQSILWFTEQIHAYHISRRARKKTDVLHVRRWRVIRRNPPEGRAKNNRSQYSRCQIFLKGNEEGNNNNNHCKVFISLEATQAKKHMCIQIRKH